MKVVMFGMSRIEIESMTSFVRQGQSSVELSK